MGNVNRECGIASGRESVGRDEKVQAYCTAVVIDTCINIARAKDKVIVLLAQRPSGSLEQSMYFHFPSCKAIAWCPGAWWLPLYESIPFLINSLVCQR